MMQSIHGRILTVLQSLSVSIRLVADCRHLTLCVSGMFYRCVSRLIAGWCLFVVYWQWNLHTYTRLTALFLGLPGWAGTRNIKPIWILLKQETVSGSGISRATCKSAPHSREITMPAPHHSVFLQAGCPFCRSTNSIKALKALGKLAVELICKKLHIIHLGS